MIGHEDVVIEVNAYENERFPASTLVRIIPTKLSVPYLNPFLFIAVFAIVFTSISVLISLILFTIVQIEIESPIEIPYHTFYEK